MVILTLRYMTGRLIGIAMQHWTSYSGVHSLCCSRLATRLNCVLKNAFTIFFVMLLFAQDNVFVMVAAVVQYRCGKDKVEDAFYTLYNPHQQIEAYVNDGELLRLECI